jgi:hypothetical protein
VKRIVTETGAELVVLARYMQILSDDLPRSCRGAASTSTTRSCPASRGQALSPGPRARVKMIGATGHYVTADLDEGPIIHQDVETVTMPTGPTTSCARAATSNAACWPKRCACTSKTARCSTATRRSCSKADGKGNAMQVNALDHVNIITDRLAETCAFYVALLGLSSAMPRP